MASLEKKESEGSFGRQWGEQEEEGKGVRSLHYREREKELCVVQRKASCCKHVGHVHMFIHFTP
jgi:hypothetical protein